MKLHTEPSNVLPDKTNGAEVIPFKLAKGEPSGDDWLRKLAESQENPWFVSKGIANKSGWLDSFGVAAVHDECILLASRNNAGFLDMNWCDSADFSRFNKLVRVLPPPEGAPEPEQPDEETGEKDG